MSLLCLLGVPSIAGREISHVRGPAWSQNISLSDPDAVPGNPVVAIDAGGMVYVAWHDARPGPAGGIYLAVKPAGTGWTTPVRIPASDAVTSSSPTIAAGTAGQVYVAWVSGVPDTRTDIVSAWSADRGRTWSEPAQINTDAGDIAGHPDLVVDNAGRVHAVWSDLATFGDPHSRDVKWAVRPAGEVAWTEPRVIHQDVAVMAEQSQPAVTVDGAGNVYAVWVDARHGSGDPHAIYAARLPQGRSAWETGWRIDQRPGQVNARPDLAATPNAGLLAVWDTGAGGDVYSATRPKGTTAWGSPVRLNSRGPATTAHIAADDEGIAHAVWQDVRNGAPDIYGATCWASAALWRHDVRISDDEDGAVQEMPAVAAGGAGRVVAVWLDHRDGPSGTVYAAELRLTVTQVRLPLLSRGQ